MALEILKMDNKKQKNKKGKEILTPTPKGEHLWKSAEDDDIDVDEVFDRPIIPGTSGVEC